jgi:hypothetical protein
MIERHYLGRVSRLRGRAFNHLSRYRRLKYSGCETPELWRPGAKILLFFDADDVADHLLEEHIKAHGRQPQEA